jgi:hypothetical protein
MGSLHAFVGRLIVFMFSSGRQQEVRMSKWMVAAAGAAVLATACAQQYEPISRDRDVSTRVRDNNNDNPIVENRDLFQGGFLSAVGGRLDGAIGNTLGIEHDAANIDFYDDGYSTSANVLVETPNGDAMLILSVQNGSLSELEDGDEVDTCQDDYNDPNSDVSNGGMGVYGTGCSGSDIQTTGFDYDAPADCTSISVSAPGEDAPAGTVATVRVLSHWSANSYGGLERTAKGTIFIAEQ